MLSHFLRSHGTSSGVQRSELYIPPVGGTKHLSWQLIQGVMLSNTKRVIPHNPNVHADSSHLHTAPRYVCVY